MIGPAPAKINLALVVGPLRDDGKHELVTVYQRIDLGDRVTVEPAADTTVTGFPEDTIVRGALALLDAPHGWRVHIDKAIPLAAGLGGGSSDAATALRLANAQLDEPRELEPIAARVGADVPFFLRDGPQLGTGDGTALEPLELPRDYTVVLAQPHGGTKSSTADVYAAFDARTGAAGFEERRGHLLEVLEHVRSTGDLARLPPNDLASSPLAAELVALGAVRADATGAGPTVFGLFADPLDAVRAAEALADRAATWVRETLRQ